jgi:hypothetical protein
MCLREWFDSVSLDACTLDEITERSDAELPLGQVEHQVRFYQGVNGPDIRFAMVHFGVHDHDVVDEGKRSPAARRSGERLSTYHRGEMFQAERRTSKQFVSTFML